MSENDTESTILSHKIIVQVADTCVLGHVVLQLSCPLAFVATLWTKVLLLLLVNPHMELW